MRPLPRSNETPVREIEKETAMEMRTFGRIGPRVSAMGLGCMRMSSFVGTQSSTDEESIATIRAALEAGINFLDTGDFYGMGHNELLVGQAIKGFRDRPL